MARKHDPTKINLEIDNVEMFSSESVEGMVIAWSSDIGFGEYTLYKYPNENVWHGSSEYMDIDDDKSFLSELMRLFLKNIKIES